MVHKQISDESSNIYRQTEHDMNGYKAVWIHRTQATQNELDKMNSIKLTWQNYKMNFWVSELPIKKMELEMLTSLECNINVELVFITPHNRPKM